MKSVVAPPVELLRFAGDRKDFAEDRKDSAGDCSPVPVDLVDSPVAARSGCFVHFVRLRVPLLLLPLVWLARARQLKLGGTQGRVQ